MTQFTPPDPDLPIQVQKRLSKRLALALGVSCFVNISLLAFGLYEWQEGGYSFLVNCPYRPVRAGKVKVYELSGKNLATLTQALGEFEPLSFDELVRELANQESVAEGYRKQDIALSLLAMHHFFDLQRALGGPVPERRQFRYFCKEGLPAQIVLYPSLTEEHFEKFRSFAKLERYPLTAQGLFERLKSSKEPELKSALLMTDEYRCADILLRRGTSLSGERVYDFLQSCDWSSLNELCDEMRARQSFTPEVRRAFLLKNLPHSASLLLETDARFSLHSLTDAQILSLLSSPALSPDEKRACSIALLESPRSEAVWNRSITLFCETAALDPTQETRASILQRTGKKIATKQEVAAPQIKANNKHDSKAVSKTVAKPPTKPAPKATPNSTPKPLPKPAPNSASKSSPKPLPKPVTKTPPPKPSTATGPTSKVPASKPTKLREVVHTVQSGDTLWKLAKRYKVDVERIKKRNNLKTDSLKPGSLLYIPDQPSPK